MDYEEIVEEIRRPAGGLGSEAAERAVQATLQPLAERLPRGEARHLLEELPAELKPWIYTETEAEPFGIDEFLGRVAQREDADLETALPHARAVFFALGDALSPEALAHLAASLPQTFDPLVAEAQHRYLDIMPADQFWGRVSRQLGIDEAAARRVTSAVLQHRDLLPGTPRAATARAARPAPPSGQDGRGRQPSTSSGCVVTTGP